MAEGEELPPVVIPLEGDDAPLLETLDRDIEALKARSAEMGDALSAGLGEGAQSAADRMNAAIEEAAGRAAGSLRGAAGEFESAGGELGTAAGDGALASLDERMAQFRAELGGLLAQGTPEADVRAEALKNANKDLVLESYAGQQGATAPTGPGGALAAEMASGGSAAVAAARSVEQDMSAVFSDIYQRGQNASFQLANALTAAWSGIEAETRGLTAKEKQIFADFNQVLTAEGQDAAVAFATGQRDVAQAVSVTAAAAAAAAAAVSGLGDAGRAASSELVFLSDAARTAYEEQTRLSQAEREGITQFALFNAQDAPGMFTRVAAASEEGATGVEQMTSAIEAASAQLALFTAEELKWTESTNMAQRPLTQSAQAGWDTGIQVNNTPFAYSSPEAEANAAKVKASLLDDAGAANEAKGSMGGLAAVMNGPLMQAFWGISSVAYLPMMIGQMIGPVTQWVDSMSGSAQAAQAAQLAAQNLGPAIAQDSGYIGDNTAATIQNILVKSNLADIAQKVGVSQATLIESVAGESAAQNAVAAAYNRKQDALNSSIKAGQTGLDTGVQQELQLQDQKNALDDLTKSTVQAMNTDRDNTNALTAAEKTTQIYTAAVADLVAKQQAQAQQAKMNADAQLQYIATLVPGTQAYTDAVYTQDAALQANAVNQKIAADAQVAYIDQVVPGSAAFSQAVKTQQENLLNTGYQAAVTAVAMLNLGDSQFNVNNQLLGAVDLYSRSATEANAYNSVLTALNSTEQTLLGSEAAFTIALDGVSKAAQANGLSLDVNNANGAKNIQTFTQLAQAADKAAVSVYQNEVNTKGASQAYADANAKLAQEKQAFIDAADKAGFNKDAVQELADALFKLPPAKEIPVTVDTSPAMAGLANLIGKIDSSYGVVNVYENSSGVVYTKGPGGGGYKASASGGPAYAGVPQIVGDTGGRAEMFVPSTDGYVYPSVDQGLSAIAAQGGFGDGQPVVNVQVLVDGYLVTGGVRATSQYTKNRNSITGMN